jgi:hypothetical protein
VAAKPAVDSRPPPTYQSAPAASTKQDVDRLPSAGPSAARSAQAPAEPAPAPARPQPSRQGQGGEQPTLDGLAGPTLAVRRPEPKAEPVKEPEKREARPAEALPPTLDSLLLPRQQVSRR